MALVTTANPNADFQLAPCAMPGLEVWPWWVGLRMPPPPCFNGWPLAQALWGMAPPPSVPCAVFILRFRALESPCPPTHAHPAAAPPDSQNQSRKAGCRPGGTAGIGPRSSREGGVSHMPLAVPSPAAFVLQSRKLCRRARSACMLLGFGAGDTPRPHSIRIFLPGSTCDNKCVLHSPACWLLLAKLALRFSHAVLVCAVPVSSFGATALIQSQMVHHCGLCRLTYHIDVCVQSLK